MISVGSALLGAQDWSSELRDPRALPHQAVNRQPEYVAFGQITGPWTRRPAVSADSRRHLRKAAGQGAEAAQTSLWPKWPPARTPFRRPGSDSKRLRRAVRRAAGGRAAPDSSVSNWRDSQALWPTYRMSRHIQVILRHHLPADEATAIHAQAEAVLAANHPGAPGDSRIWG
jgi:hypothetical protein